MVMEEVKTQYNPKELEERIRKFWEKNKIPQKLQQAKKKKFYLLDGPPYVNQIAHVGHVKTTTMKDIWTKFKQMQGFNVWLQPGFDCHGLPIENMVERELGIKSKKEIEEMGIDKFIQTCHSHAEDKKDEWLKLYKLLGAWRGWFEPYLTYKNYYIEAGWWTVKKMNEKGMLVEGEKPTFWCVHCETALAGAELEYEDVKDPSIYVKFPIKGRENEYILIWTTTPWTLISNVAIAVHPNEYYVKVKVGNEILILAEKRLEPVKQLCKLKCEVLEKFLGKELDGLKYEPLFDIPVQQKLKLDLNSHRIVLSIPVMIKEQFRDFVTMEEGSGCVHTAPGHGAEDYSLGKHYNLPIASPVDNEGKFTDEAGEFSGIFVKDADRLIIEKLKEKGLLLHSSWIVHSYPHCWRCGSPLIYRLSKQWFFKVDIIKQKMIKENEKVKWLPSFGKERFHNWLISATDWCISRQRYWGIPLPVWVCEKCRTKEVIGSVKELREKASKKLPKEIDLHRHVVDKIELICKNCDSLMHRVPDILDVWFDSGISPWASLSKEQFEKLWPVDFISEAQDQFRGWFYSLMFCGVSVFDRSPYEAVGWIGWVLDEKGEKMSKSLGNVVWGKDAVEKLGADILRLYYCWEVPPWEIQKFSFKTAEEVKRALNILCNSYGYFTIYCEKDFRPKLANLKLEDKWMLSKLNTLISEVTNHFENFEFHYIGRKLMDFVVNDLSRFYIKLIRDRVWVSEKGKDKQAALSTLYEVLVTIAKLFAPITPFISEEIYGNLARNLDSKAPLSIFMCEWPKENKKFIDKTLEEQMEIAKKIINASYSARQEAKLKLRWPVRQVLVVSDDKKIVQSVKNLNDVLKFMCNAKNIEVVKQKPRGQFSEAEFELGKILIDKVLDEKLLEEALVREVIREVQAMRKKHGFVVKEKIALTLNSDEKTNKVLEENSEKIKKEVGAEKIFVGKLEGKFESKLEFEDKVVKIKFDRL
jgi:isoleucyl-tRNA synthetase